MPIEYVFLCVIPLLCGIPVGILKLIGMFMRQQKAERLGLQKEAQRRAEEDLRRQREEAQARVLCEAKRAWIAANAAPDNVVKLYPFLRGVIRPNKKDTWIIGEWIRTYGTDIVRILDWEPYRLMASNLPGNQRRVAELWQKARPKPSELQIFVADTGPGKSHYRNVPPCDQ